MKRTLQLTALLLGLLLLAGCTQKVESYIDTTPPELVEAGVYTFSDGMTADLWMYPNHTELYRLPDGTDLLTQWPTSGTAIYAHPQDRFEELDETVQLAIETYYEEQGLLYDIFGQLGIAYADYLAHQETGAQFSPHFVDQSIGSTSSNDRIICFSTSVSRSVASGIYEEQHLGAIFDRETGAEIPLWDLFTVPEEEARQKLLDACDLARDAPLEEMRAAFDPSFVILDRDSILVEYPAGSLPSQSLKYVVYAKYKDLEDVLHPWAIPGEAD